MYRGAREFVREGKTSTLKPLHVKISLKFPNVVLLNAVGRRNTQMSEKLKKPVAVSEEKVQERSPKAGPIF